MQQTNGNQTRNRPRQGRPPPRRRPRRRGPGLAARLRNYLLAGVLVTAPIAITFYLAWLFINVIDGLVTDFLPARFNPETYLPFSIPGIGLFLVAFGLIMIGFLTANFIGRQILQLGEAMVRRIPAVRSVYGAIKQILETVLATQSDAFREVVLVEYPRRGLWAIGFITGATEGEVQNLVEDDLVNIFVPTTPNPTSGFLLFVPRRDLVVLNMNVEDGIKMVVSGGIVTPPDPRPQEAKDKPVVQSGRPEAA